MSSFHQIILGAGCVTGAFLLGHYLNRPLESTEPTEHSVAQAIHQALDQDWQPGMPAPSDLKAKLPSYRSPFKIDFELESGSKLPPPSDLAPSEKGDRSAAQITEWQFKSTRPNTEDRPASVETTAIEVPDFSQLADQFRGTNLELLPLTQSPNRELDNQDNLQALTPDFNRSQVSSFNQPDSGSRFEQTYVPPIDPDRLDDSALSYERSNFNPQDFSPQLREHPATKNNVQPVQSSVLESTAPIGLSTGQTELVDRTNRVISYSDPFPPLSATKESPNQAPRGWTGAGGRSESRPLDHNSLSPEQPVSAGGNPQGDGNWQRRNSDSSAHSVIDRQIEPLKLNYPVTFEEEADLNFDRSVPSPSQFNSNVVSGQLKPLSRSLDQRIEVRATRFINHQTRAGETLSTISSQYYGKPDFYLDIYLVNQTQMRHPGDIQAGVVLRIPVYD